MAEEVGFEPTVPFLIHRLSRSAHSTTLALLHFYQIMAEKTEKIKKIEKPSVFEKLMASHF